LAISLHSELIELVSEQQDTSSSLPSSCNTQIATFRR